MSANNLQILIVEDDLSFAIELDMLVREVGYEVLGRVDNSAEALELIMSEQPNLILMDIDIKGRLSGIEVAEKVQHLNVPVLFITSYSEQEKYERAKQANAIGYLVKPINRYSLQSAVELAIRSISTNVVKNQQQSAFSNDEELYFKKKGIYQRVFIKDITYIQASGDYTITHTTDNQFISSLRLSELEKLLQSQNFVKVHRSFLVNLKKATSINFDQNKIMIHEDAIPFSRRIKAVLLQKLKMIK